MEWLIIILYTISLALITLFSLGQLNLAIHYVRNKNKKSAYGTLREFPFVTIQLPIYNEKYVVQRLLKTVAALDYPKSRFEIQVLDDSNDETVEIVRSLVDELKQDNFQIHHLRRSDRTGYKAGALQYGTKIARGEFIAIFDADFLPKRDFLQKTLPHFEDDSIGMVQTRWSHINKDYSIFTRMQAFGLDAHFSVEQNGRMMAGSCISFNGTAGIWRKKCIENAGGWQHDTLTEDLDLSYRAQLGGWKFRYLDEVDTPGELPVVVEAIKSQQYRWNKGAVETARKNLVAVFKSDLKFVHKLRAAQHLLNSSVFLLLLIAAILSIPLLYIKKGNPTLAGLFDVGSVFILGFIAIGIFYLIASKARQTEKSTRYFLKNFPLFMIFSMGLAVHNSIAIIEGLIGKKTAFIRTPKFNITSNNQSWRDSTYLVKSLPLSTILEGLLAIYFIFGVGIGVHLEDYGLILFHLMMALGLGIIFATALRQSKNVA